MDENGIKLCMLVVGILLTFYWLASWLEWWADLAEKNALEGKMWKERAEKLGWRDEL